MNALESLKSDDPPEIIDGLYKIGAGPKGQLAPEILQCVVSLVSHADPAVREEVAACAGIRLRVAEMYPFFWNRLNGGEQDVVVIPTLINAVTALAHGDEQRETLTRLLAKYLLDEMMSNEKMSDEIKGSAYLAILRLWDRISQKDYAVAPRKLTQMNFQPNLVRSLLK